MKDPRVGAMAVAAMLVVLLVKFAAITALLAQAQDNIGLLLGGLLLIPMLARTGIIGLMASTDYVRQHGMVTATQSAATKTKVVIMTVLLTLFAVPLLREKTLMMLLVWLGLLVAYRAALKKRLGGYTGDTLGAAVEFQETILLVALAL
jgi:adenosylcobinamide-GDP ribazoletransferase